MLYLGNGRYWTKPQPQDITEHAMRLERQIHELKYHQ